MRREYLPLNVANLMGYRSGDGMLRLQARKTYRSMGMRHPLEDWRPALQETFTELRATVQNFASGVLNGEGP